MTMDLGTLAILLPMLFLLLGLGFTVVIDPYIQQKQRRIMLLIVVLCLSLIAQNTCENTLFVSRSHLAVKNLLSAYGYSVRPVFLALFLYIIRPNGRKWPVWALVDEIRRRNILIPTLYSNGLLITDAFLDELEKRGLHPNIQFSFDGVGYHDWMRGIPG